MPIYEILRIARRELNPWNLLPKQRFYWVLGIVPVCLLFALNLIFQSSVFLFASLLIFSGYAIFLRQLNYKKMALNYQINSSDQNVFLTIGKKRIKNLLQEWEVRDVEGLKILFECLKNYIDAQKSPHEGIGILFSIFGTLAVVVIGLYTQSEKFTPEELKIITSSLIEMFFTSLGAFIAVSLILRAIYNFIFRLDLTTAKVLLSLLNEIILEEAFKTKATTKS